MVTHVLTSPKSPRLPDLRYFIKVESFSADVTNTDKNDQRVWNLDCGYLRSLGHQSLPPTNLGRVHEDMASPEYTITGPEQIRSSDFAKELKILKKLWLIFFISHWATDKVVPFIGNKIIHINFRKCHSFTINESNKVVSRVDKELSCPAHEEAYANIVYHACNINYPAEIVIRSIDTDIAAIMLGNMHPLKSDSVVWMLTGTGNNLRYVDLTKIHAELGQLICQLTWISCHHRM
ncbi:uncharacterized protein TNCV_4772022 [Trichonephila clavipes]|nr:uncharacterized protein TNCV_4772022 [Trichonephila clavipes]